MNICEYIRQESIKNLFAMSSFSDCWNIWRPQIESKLDCSNPSTIFNLGDELSSIFKSTANGGRQGSTNGSDAQGNLSAGGSCWEGLVCWYLNLCLIGTRVVVIKHSKKLIPTPIADAITVSYDSFPKIIFTIQFFSLATSIRSFFTVTNKSIIIYINKIGTIINQNLNCTKNNLLIKGSTYLTVIKLKSVQYNENFKQTKPLILNLISE